MKSTLAILSVFLLSLFACQSLKYKSDIGFLNSAQANSPEYLVKINGKFCKDIDGMIGLCAKRIKSNEKITFVLDKRPYSYRVNVECSSLVDFSLSIDVLANSSFEFEITPDKFPEAKTFTCIGEVFPQDREEEVSAFWHTRFVVYDKSYQARESINVQGDQLVLGQHAKYTLLNEEKNISKKTSYNFKDVKRAWSESEIMRMNFYGY
jgi:hypothetical protein